MFTAGCLAPDDANRVVLLSAENLSQVTIPDTLDRIALGVSMRAQLETPSEQFVTKDMGLTLLATIPSPVYDGAQLQATDVAWVGDRVYASYNFRGERFLGAIQIIDVGDRTSPEVLREAIYPHTDINRIEVAGNTIFAAAADETTGAAFERFELDDVDLKYLGYESIPSYSATYVSLDGYRAYVSFGDVLGGHAVFDLHEGNADLLGILDSQDARWVTEVGDFDVLGVSGSPGRLTHFADAASGTASSESTIEVEGANIGAPTWALRSSDLLYLSSDDAGLQIYDINQMQLVGTLATAGTANGSALASDRRLAFLANGEEGLIVADVLDASHPIALAQIDVSNDSGSANAVAVQGEYLALADGLGGVKILHYDRVQSNEQGDCDSDGIPDVEDIDDDNDGVLDLDDAAPCEPDIACQPDQVDVVASFVGDFYNLPCDHPDVNAPVTGVVTGNSPHDTDWYTEPYAAFTIGRESLLIDYSQDYFPVDEGLCGDPYYFAAHWYTTAVATEAGEYTFEMGSDDDSWLYIDGKLHIDLGGIHALARTSATVQLSAGAHRIDIYFAERHIVQSGLEFEVTGFPSQTARLETIQHVCLPPDGDADADGSPNQLDIAPLTRHL